MNSLSSASPLAKINQARVNQSRINQGAINHTRHHEHGLICHPEQLLGEAVSRALVDGTALGGACSVRSINAAVAALRAPTHVVIVSAHLDHADLDDLLEALEHRRLRLPVLTLHDRADVAAVVDDIERGAAGVLSLHEAAGDLCAAVRVALAGGLVIPSDLQPEALHLLAARATQRTEAHRALSVMTPREREILQLLVAGVGRIQMARQLGLSIHTARTHLERVKAKLGARTQLEAATEGRRLLSIEQIGARRAEYRQLKVAAAH